MQAKLVGGPFNGLEVDYTDLSRNAVFYFRNGRQFAFLPALSELQDVVACRLSKHETPPVLVYEVAKSAQSDRCILTNCGTPPANCGTRLAS